MIETIFSVLIGGVLTLLGTLLADYLQYRSEQRKWKRERTEERFAEVRRYLITCLDFAGLMNALTELRKDLKIDQVEEFKKFVSDYYGPTKPTPAVGSARALFIEDKELLEWLEKIVVLKTWLYFSYQDFIIGGQAIPLQDRNREFKDLTLKAGERLDKLLDKI